MRSKERWKYHGTHRICHRPRNWALCFREGWLEEDPRGLRRQRVAFIGSMSNRVRLANVPDVSFSKSLTSVFLGTSDQITDG